MTCATMPAFDFSSAMMTTVSSGRSRWKRSTSVRIWRRSTDSRSIQISPFSRMAISRLPDSRCSAVDASGFTTVTPASLMNDVVMMKKINRLIVKSSIGARSMPCSSLSAACRRMGLFLRCEGDVVDAAEMNLIDDLDERAGRCTLRGEDQDPGVRAHRGHALDVCAHGAHVDRAIVDPDFPVIEDLDLDALDVLV